ncbi:MAG TPA: pyruvate, phosphate dikinase/phosphoenolpyruvate synthase regulator [Thermodesulfobacteriota bacterium]|nr:pyruvate, phosphate dikinase/phosphoenolpyruvate synthase regulator [Thermodesulfobacteriota bacterium]
MTRSKGGTQGLVIVVADGMGEAPEGLVREALRAFEGRRPVVRTWGYVREEIDFDAIVESVRADAAGSRPAVLVVALADPGRRTALLARAEKAGVRAIDILGPLARGLADAFRLVPRVEGPAAPGLDPDYFRRLEAIDFTVKHDDGQGLATLSQAEVVLVGPSRTSKTPVSVYLATRGWKVANVPFVPDVEPPPELLRLPEGRICGLTIAPASLLERRLARLSRIGVEHDPLYADPKRVAHEVMAGRALCTRHSWRMVDVTGKGVEEVAQEVLAVLGKLGPGVPPVS